MIPTASGIREEDVGLEAGQGAGNRQGHVYRHQEERVEKLSPAELGLRIEELEGILEGEG